LNGSFEQSAPKVGELLPDVSALDADGKPLELRSLKGHYSVLVFGCLT
jgi:peroxiredoxin